ncbi:hypothetical protein SUGI_0918940 [Cryptomeria japonica]|nr:hypothetical protein SUGI_0918940 [Cryptomeria japonica]
MTEIVHERFRLSIWFCSCTWALAMDRGVNMVTINVGLVEGPGFAYKTSGPIITHLIVRESVMASTRRGFVHKKSYISSSECAMFSSSDALTEDFLWKYTWGSN